MKFASAQARIKRTGNGWTVIFMGATYNNVTLRSILVETFIQCSIGHNYKDVLIECKTDESNEKIEITDMLLA